MDRQPHLHAMNEVTDNNLVFPLVDGGASTRAWLEGGLALLDGERRLLDINGPLANWLGMGPEAITGKSIDAILLPQFPEWIAFLNEAWTRAETFQQKQLKSASLTPQQWHQIEITRLPSGWLLRVNSLLPPQTDLAEAAWNEHLRSEAAQRGMFVRLLRAEAQLDNLVHRWPGVIFSQRADFSFQFASPGIEELTGIPAAQFNRQPQKFWEIIHESDAEELRQQIKRTIQSRQGVSSTYRIRHAQTGRIAYLLEHRQAVVSGSGLLLGFEGVWLDVTRQTIAEKRLSAAAWKETLAVLTMGLAHDFSNIMAGIHSLSESFLSQAEPTHPFREGLELIKQNSLQANQLVHRIIQLHHGKTGERNYHNLNEIIADLVDLARKILPRRLRVAVELAGEPLPIYADSVEFCQVVLNLTLNASDAMPQAGTLAFVTSLHPRYPKKLGFVVGALPRLPAVCLTVQDSGSGIPESHLGSIFDPFFTTKPLNKGSGLGLYNARLFVEKHHGAISVVSHEKQGTAFRIWLPMADFTEAERSLQEDLKQRQSLLLGGCAGERLDSVAEFLRVQNFHVVTANSPEKAREQLHSGECDFSAAYLLLDAEFSAWAAVLRENRARRKPLRTILQVVGCNQDEIPPSVLQQADLVLDPNLDEDAMLRKIKAVLEEQRSTSL